MKKKCHIVETNSFDTAGERQKVLVCYCGTTGCLQIQIQYYPLPSDFKKPLKLYENELSPEEEKRFYKTVLNSSLNRE